jgi:hypothetical protein
MDVQLRIYNIMAVPQLLKGSETWINRGGFEQNINTK